MNIGAISPILSILLVMGTCNEWVSAMMKRIMDSFDIIFNSNIYVFFDKYPCPFPARAVRLDSSNSAPPTIMYNADTRMFFPYINNDTNMEALRTERGVSLPILSIEIIDSELETVFDLTNFVAKVKYISVTEGDCPTISELIMAWSIESNIVLNKDIYQVRYINTECNTYVVTLNDGSELATDTDTDASSEEKPHTE